MFQLVRVNRDFLVERLADARDHQLRRKRPGLAGDIADLADMHAGFLQRLAPHRILDALPHFEEPGERRIAVRGPARLAAEHHPIAMFGKHDHHRIDARIMLGPAVRAEAAPAGAEDVSRGTAARTKAVARMPVDQAARGGIVGCILGPEGIKDRRKLGRAPGRQRRTRYQRLHEARLAVEEAEEQQRLGRGIETGPDQPPVAVQLRHQPVHHQQPRARVGERRRQQLGFVADAVVAVERAAGEAGDVHFARSA